MAEAQKPADYRHSKSYTKANSETRRAMERYKAELNITDDHMAWLLYLQDLREIPKEERQKGNLMAEGAVIGAMVLFMAAIQGKNRTVQLIASILVIVMTVVYLSGIMNPYTDTLRRVKKVLKKQYPEVPDFGSWQKQHTEDKKDK